MWGVSLSAPLGIVGLVGRRPANYLMPRMPIRNRQGFQPPAMRPGTLRGISGGFPPLSPCCGQVAYALRTRAPVVSRVSLLPVTPRLACVKPAASVHPEPGSNSSLYELLLYLLDSSRVTPTGLAGGHKTHAISCFKIIQCSLAFHHPFINRCFLQKSECKDTTFF